MTLREAQVLTAFTGINCLKNFKDIYPYAEELLGTGVTTIGLALCADKLKELSKPEFLRMIENTK